MRRRIPLVTLAALSLTLAGTIPARAADPAKVVLISLDGGGERFLEKLVASGKMPNLAAIKRNGVQADYALTNYPSKTAAGHASLWTGAYGNISGITGNEIPLQPAHAYTILEHQRGFESTALLAEPLWVAAARAGKRTLAVQATHLTPFETYGPKGRFGGADAERMTFFDGYTGKIAPEWVLDSTASFKPAVGWKDLPVSREAPYEIALPVGPTTLYGVIYNDPTDPVQGYDTLQIRPSKDSARGAVLVKAGAPNMGSTEQFSLPVPVSVGNVTPTVRFRLFELSPNGASLLLYRTPLAMDNSNRPELAAEWAQRTGGFVPKGAEDLYAHGKLGPTLIDGGTGLAEERLLETIRLAMESRIAKLRHGAKAYPWDLLVNYVPYPDSVEHMWYGLADSTSTAYRPDVGPKFWTYMETVAGYVDEFLGAARQVAGDRGVIAVVSDHGMEGLSRDFLPNVALRKAGLLAVDANGKVDLSRTKAMYPPSDGACVVINSVRRKGGIVKPEEEAAVLEQVITTLREARDPKSNRPIVTGFYPTREADPALGLGGPNGGDLYLDLMPGVYFSAAHQGDALFVDRHPFASGGHVFNPSRASMHAVCYMAGPGLKKGVMLPPIRTIDVAPTLAKLMGIPAPAQATGRVLTEALSN
ncbi:alkaline phosphatase family protein [bacterium]|nr:alkaline phosphatase family protein [bacterium]